MKQKIEGGKKLLRLVTFGVDVSENQDDGVWSILAQNGLENLFGKRIYNLSYRDIDEHPTTPIQETEKKKNGCFMCQAIEDSQFPFDSGLDEYTLDSESCINDENGNTLITIYYCPVCGKKL